MLLSIYHVDENKSRKREGKREREPIKVDEI